MRAMKRLTKAQWAAIHAKRRNGNGFSGYLDKITPDKVEVSVHVSTLPPNIEFGVNATKYNNKLYKIIGKQV